MTKTLVDFHRASEVGRTVVEESRKGSIGIDAISDRLEDFLGLPSAGELDIHIDPQGSRSRFHRPLQGLTEIISDHLKNWLNLSQDF